MKKCLLIAYFYPPRPVIGAQRPSKLAKYFPEYGWEPVVLTAKLPGRTQNGTRIVETQYKDIVSSVKSALGFDAEKGFQEQLNIYISKNYEYPSLTSKIIKLSKELIAYPDPEQGWQRPAIKSAYELLTKENFDAIISTSPPATSHIIAREIKKAYGIPWVADLRDLWTQHHFYNKYNVVRYFEKRLELRTLALADALVTVTPRFADNLRMLHKSKQIYCITNGYDADDFPEAPIQLTRKFTITYTGSLYRGAMDPSLLFEVVASLLSEKRIKRDLIEIRFYGAEEYWLKDDIKKFGLEGIVNYYGFLPREIVLEKQKKSQLLLLLLENKEVDYYPAKIFEYFGARRPIIAFGGAGGAVKKLLKEINAGEFAEGKNDLKNILCRYYEEYIRFGNVSCINNNGMDNYTYKNITKKYSEILTKSVTQHTLF